MGNEDMKAMTFNYREKLREYTKIKDEYFKSLKLDPEAKEKLPQPEKDKMAKIEKLYNEKLQALKDFEREFFA